MVKLLALVMLTVGWISAAEAEIDAISYESLIPAGSPCDTTSRVRDRMTQPVERIANFVMVVSNKGHCEHHMGFKEVDAIASELIAQCEWVADDPAFACHTVMVNEKWIARASDFERLAPARIRWNRRTHMLRQVQSMTLNQRAKLLIAGEIDHNLAFGNFDFTAPLSKTEIPNYGVVALTQYGRETESSFDNPWQASVRQRVVHQLKQQPNAILLAPVRTIGYGLNAAHRQALSLKIAHHIVKMSGYRVHDPLLVQRAFGPGVRSISTDRLFELAADAKASVVVIPEVGHDNANNLVFRTRLIRMNASEPKLETPKQLTGRREFEINDNLVVELASYAQRVSAVVNEVVGAVVKKTPGATAARQRNRAIDAVADFGGFENIIPPLNALARDERSVPNAILQYQWLGSLVPETSPKLRSELFARSLVLLQSYRTRQVSTDQRLLTARALAELGALPASRKITGNNAATPLLAGYHAFTLGQIDAMQTRLNQVQPTVLRDLLLTDRMRLQRSIGRADATWPMLLAQTVKYPSWERVLLRDIDAQRLIDAKTRGNQCEPGAPFCPNQALSLVLDAIAAHTIAAALNSQAASDALLDYVGDLDTVMAGHPVYEEAVLQTGTVALGQKALGETEQDWLRKRIAASQSYLKTGLEFSDSELVQPGKSYSVVMFPAHKYRRANDQDFPPVFSNGRRYQFSRFSQGEGLTDFFFFRMPDSRLAASNSVGASAQR